MSVPPEMMRIAVVLQAGGQGFGVGHDLRGVGFEAGLQGLFKRDGLGGDDVHQRAALLTGEDRPVEALGKLGIAQGKAAAGPAQGLVGSGGDHVRVRDG